MDRTKEDPEREERIAMETIVDAYGPEERAMGWYYYLKDRIAFPFQGRCLVETRISPLKKGETVQVIALAPEEDCMCTMLVIVEWHGREMGIKLEQIEAVEIDDESKVCS